MSRHDWNSDQQIKKGVRGYFYTIPIWQAVEMIGIIPGAGINIRYPATYDWGLDPPGPICQPETLRHKP